MRISKISSKATYHKCLKNLHAQGYIKYEPSYNPFKGSHVFLFNFSDDLKPLPKNASSNSKLVNEQVMNKSCTSDGTSAEQVSEQVVVPYINNTNIPNDSNNRKIVNESEQAKKIEENRNDEFVIPSAVEGREANNRKCKILFPSQQLPGTRSSKILQLFLQHRLASRWKSTHD